MGNKGDLTNFEHGTILGAQQAGLNISETDDFHRQPSVGFTENGIGGGEGQYLVTSRSGIG